MQHFLAEPGRRNRDLVRLAHVDELLHEGAHGLDAEDQRNLPS